jgi:hypothetical protein
VCFSDASFPCSSRVVTGRQRREAIRFVPLERRVTPGTQTEIGNHRCQRINKSPGETGPCKVRHPSGTLAEFVEDEVVTARSGLNRDSETEEAG